MHDLLCSCNGMLYGCQGDDDEGNQSQEVPLVEQFTGVGIKVSCDGSLDLLSF